MTKIVMIIGAGASQEFGFPTGGDLMGQIGNLCKFDTRYNGIEAGDRAFFGLLKKASEKFDVRFDEVLAGARLISQNMHLAPSIDNFLHTHSESEELVIAGKLAIFTCLRRAEEGSSLFEEEATLGRPRVPEFATRTWLVELFKILASGRTSEQFLKDLSEIRFISFNYDRCIERFFTAAYESYFNNPGAAADLADNLNILHPYGVLEQYDFANINGDRRMYSGGFPVVALDAVDNIRTFTEGSEKINRGRLETQITDSSVVMFLGFGFHALNNRLLPGKKVSGEVLATSYGLSQSNKSEIEHELIANIYGGDPRYKKNIQFSDCKCSELISRYSRLLERILN